MDIMVPLLRPFDRHYGLYRHTSEHALDAVIWLQFEVVCNVRNDNCYL